MPAHRFQCPHMLYHIVTDVGPTFTGVLVEQLQVPQKADSTMQILSNIVPSNPRSSLWR